MIDNLGGVTSQIANIALDAAVLRQQVIAHNIANARTEGFVPKRVEFAEQLSTLIEQLRGGTAAADIDDEMKALQKKVDEGSLVKAQPDQLVEVDEEMVNLTETVLYYRALLEAQSKRGDIMRMAIRERSM